MMFWLVTPWRTAGEAGLWAGLPGELVWGLATVTAGARPATVRPACALAACTCTGLLPDCVLSGSDTTVCPKVGGTGGGVSQANSDIRFLYVCSM